MNKLYLYIACLFAGTSCAKTVNTSLTTTTIVVNNTSVEIAYEENRESFNSMAIPTIIMAMDSMEHSKIQYGSRTREDLLLPSGDEAIPSYSITSIALYNLADTTSYTHIFDAEGKPTNEVAFRDSLFLTHHTDTYVRVTGVDDLRTIRTVVDTELLQIFTKDTTMLKLFKEYYQK